MGGVSWDKVGVNKVVCEEQNYNERTHVGFFFFYRIALLLYCFKIKPVYHCLSWFYSSLIVSYGMPDALVPEMFSHGIVCLLLRVYPIYILPLSVVCLYVYV